MRWRPPSAARSPDEDRLSAQRRIIQLLHRGEERVEIDMKDGSGLSH
jgi:hypothetical protein